MPVTQADIAASDQIAQENAKKEAMELPRAKRKGKRVHVYVCPEPECPDYYGANGSFNLEEQIVGQRGMNLEPRPQAEWHSRAQCPTCRALGKRVDRVRVELFVPMEALTVAGTA